MPAVAIYRKKGNNVNAFPRPITRELYACVCYGCDSYFWVERGAFHVSQIRCPMCNSSKSDSEVLGMAKAEITMNTI